MSVQSPAYDVRHHNVVSADEWLDARKALLSKEKEFTRLRDELSQARRNLPWEQVTKNYVFDGPVGKRSLSDLFGANRQLIVQHFMFDTSWDEGCKSCSFWADTYNANVVHLRARDTAFAAISHAPLAKLLAYEKRMGWSFPWYSSSENAFNRDFGVSFTHDEIDNGLPRYNYDTIPPYDTETPGISVFYKDDDGSVYHTYSAYARGVDILNGAYNLLDLTPKGRDEQPPMTQKWVRRHDEYAF
jgi:predicted dithiol-disulfide oxidoreductase (DUF899 family)